MTAIRETLTLEEVAAIVCTALERHGIRAVLSGGSVVSIYSDNEYESKDLDFIIEGIAKRVDPAMQELGFQRQVGRHWTHPHSEFWVEFPPGPLQVGDQIVTNVAERRTAFGVLRLLRPTECVMDRLAAYYHWNDPQGLDQALSVARRHEIDLRAIEDWSRRERATAKLQDFLDRLEAERTRG